MSKKKKAAKLEAQRSRKELLARRIDDAAAFFLGGFPTPYADDAEEAADRQLCVELRERAITESKDDALAGEIFEELPDETVAFRRWTVAFRDELARRHGSLEEAEERARFHLAQVWVAERREDFDPELARVARILITSLELEVPGSETPEPASEAQAEDETP
jgi:hypothetical protein